jgi:hypothetical protein
MPVWTSPAISSFQYTAPENFSYLFRALRANGLLTRSFSGGHTPPSICPTACRATFGGYARTDLPGPLPRRAIVDKVAFKWQTAETSRHVGLQ